MKQILMSLGALTLIALSILAVGLVIDLVKLLLDEKREREIEDEVIARMEREFRTHRGGHFRA